VKQAFRDILAAKPVDRRQVYADATETWPTSAHFIEKDFLVCATLSVLFEDVPDAAHKLVFKGGTSLSKAHNLIQRFSEDIDLVVVREELGFSGDRDPFNTDISGKRRQRLKDELRAEAATFIAETIKPRLEAAFAPFGANISVDEEDPQTLLIAYQSALDDHLGYVDPIVKIEGGARSATLPAHPAEVVPYTAAVLDELDLRVPHVQTIDAERTFLDKLLILHGRHCFFRDRGGVFREAKRESRHYYDLAMMADEIGPRALGNAELLEDVIRHGSLGFASAWMKFDEAAEGRLQIEPPTEVAAALRRDYTAMAGMILGEAPPFDWVMERISAIARLYARRANRLRAL